MTAALEARVESCRHLSQTAERPHQRAYWRARMHEAETCLYLVLNPGAILPLEIPVMATRQAPVVLTEAEVDVMQHALGWPKTGFRNFFTTLDPGYLETWLGLVQRGLASEGKNALSPDRLFQVTSTGRAAFDRHMAGRKAG